MPDHIDQKLERWNKAVKLSEEVLDECRIQLMLKFRFMDLALWRMPGEATHSEGRYPLWTDAKSIYFEPFSVLGRFEESLNETIRDYLHLIMHCVFRHPYDTLHLKNHKAWWLACDVLVENVVMDMCRTRFKSDRDNERRAVISELQMALGTLMPAKLYHFFDELYKSPYGSQIKGFEHSRLAEMQELFERDNHEAWPAYARQEEKDKPGDIEQVAEHDDDSDESTEDSTDHDVNFDNKIDSSGDQQAQDLNDDLKPNADEDSDAQGKDKDADDTESADDTTKEAGQTDESSEDEISRDNQSRQDSEDEKSEDEKDWEEISKQIEMDLETFSKEWGDEAGSLIASLEISNRQTYNYTNFLRRFAVMTEDMKINDDEFDYIYYTYGMDLYGNTPLIEPLEYMEIKRVRDFVIALDTSGSVQGELVKRFVQHSFDILKESEGFTKSDVNIHIIQCDAMIQADTKITKLSDIDKYMEHFFVRGFGGTDFRPVFDYITDLRTRGELTDLQGLIYFTDGLGTFPASTPDYDVAFVFIDNGQKHLPSIPPWAMRIVLNEDGIERLQLAARR